MSKLRDENVAKCLDMIAKKDHAQKAVDHLNSLSSSGPGSGGSGGGGDECKEQASGCG